VACPGIYKKGLAVDVRIVGADQALKALRTMEPETAKQVGREIKKAGDVIAAHIRGRGPGGPPMTGWREQLAARPRGGGRGWPAWAPIGASVSRRGTSVIVSSTGASAAIYESAGSINPGGATDPMGGQFINNLSRHGRLVQSGKKKGRLARVAIKEYLPQAQKDVEAACDRAVQAVNRRMP
jgi:hypothetical protein